MAIDKTHPALTCKRCNSSEDVRVCEYVFRSWPIDCVTPERQTELLCAPIGRTVETVNEGVVLTVVSGTDTVTWEASDGIERLSCSACGLEWPMPDGVRIEWR
jgi:hypothetical protein